MLDYHLHLWPHDQRDPSLAIEQVAAYCERAQAAGVVEVALTEHLFRFAQADRLLGGFWEEDEPSEALRRSMADYWDFHARADLDAYVETALEAKRAGLPVVLGLEVDYYRGRMDQVATLLEAATRSTCCWVRSTGSGRGGSTTWTTRRRWPSGRPARSTPAGTPTPTAIEELAATRTCDVLAHPDLIKVTGPPAGQPGRVVGPHRRGGGGQRHGGRAVLGRLAQAGGGAVPGRTAAGPLGRPRGAADHRLRRPPRGAGGRPGRRPAGRAGLGRRRPPPGLSRGGRPTPVPLAPATEGR